MRALIVDDSLFMRDCLTSMLHNCGLDCTAATDGVDGLTCLNNLGPYDVVLVDWNMPVMNGLEMVKAVRRNPNLDSLKILMVTLETENQVIADALEAGANEFLMKPFDENSLMDKLAMIGVLPS